MQINGMVSTEAPPASSSTRAETLSSLCTWWADTKQEPLPSICHQFISPQHREHLWSVLHRHPTHSRDQPFIRHTSHTSHSDDLLYTNFGTGRSISLIGILGGVFFILLIVAVITCCRRRKRCGGTRRQREQAGDLLSQQLHQLHQLRASHHLLGLAREAPPDYSTVCKQKEEEEGELPSYSEALQLPSPTSSPQQDQGEGEVAGRGEVV